MMFLIIIDVIHEIFLGMWFPHEARRCGLSFVHYLGSRCFTRTRAEVGLVFITGPLLKMKAAYFGALQTAMAGWFAFLIDTISAPPDSSL